MYKEHRAKKTKNRIILNKLRRYNNNNNNNHQPVLIRYTTV